MEKRILLTDGTQSHHSFHVVSGWMSLYRNWGKKNEENVFSGAAVMWLRKNTRKMRIVAFFDLRRR